MEYDLDRFRSDVEGVNEQLRLILMGNGGPVIMASLAFITAEALTNVSDPDMMEANVENFAKAVKEYITTFKTMTGETVGTA